MVHKAGRYQLALKLLLHEIHIHGHPRRVWWRPCAALLLHMHLLLHNQRHLLHLQCQRELRALTFRLEHA